MKTIREFWWIIGLAVLGILGIGYNRYMEYQKAEIAEEKELQRKMKQAISDERDWLRMEWFADLALVGRPDPILSEGRMPTLPMPPVEFLSDQVEVDFSLYLEWFVRNHPRSEIRVDLNERLESGELQLKLETAFRYSAQVDFIEWARGDIRFFQPVLSVNPKSLRGLIRGENRQRLQMMLVLWHEYQHLRQWDALGEDYSAKKRFMSLISPPGEPCTDADSVAEWYRYEFDAYSAECELAREWGYAGVMSDFCIQKSETDANKALALIFVNHYRGVAHPSCLAFMEKAAGHPQWRAFLAG
ncbi:MAG: hypothetical protein WC730_04080 [Patescibacteria group bacterium]|jgi:hypothetical protein